MAKNVSIVFVVFCARACSEHWFLVLVFPGSSWEAEWIVGLVKEGPALQGTAFYQYLLGLPLPRTVSRVQLDVTGQCVDVWGGTSDVPDYALVVGNPGRVTGWMCLCGVKLRVKGKKAACPTCGQQYRAERTGMTAV